jgi:hypothetical protein
VGQESHLHPAVLESAADCPQSSIVVSQVGISGPNSATSSIVVHSCAPGLVSELVSCLFRQSSLTRLTAYRPLLWQGETT